MATIADPTSGSPGAPSQTAKTAQHKSKHKPVSTYARPHWARPHWERTFDLKPVVRGVQALGCCQGGSATGANAWTDGLDTSAEWPANTAASAAGASPWPVKAAPLAQLAPSWWTHGEIEFGGRDFTNDPTRGGSIFGNTSAGGYVYLGEKSLANYYEYSTVAPGAFGGGHVATGSNDGLYQADLWANNIGSNFAGFSDQAYLLNLSKVGEQYLSFQWDETPHVYSTSAQTPYLGVGSNNLTLPFTTPITGGAGIVPYLHQTDLGIQRNTASVNYRWTPTDAWDINTNYSHMDRTGTQAAGIVEFDGFEPTQVPAPVNDTTQNFGANGEYVGTSPWGQRVTAKLAYSGSVYTDNISSYTVQNPYFPTLGSCKAATANCVSAQMSTPPSNQANGVSGTLAADLPYQSRYVGTLDYTMMTQNATFQPMTNNPNAVAATALPGSPNWNTVNYGFINGNLADPTSSLNGWIGTLLSNNELISHVTSDLTQKLSYRYYDFDNQTPRIIFPEWVAYDGTGAALEGTISTLTMSYIKQDAGAEWNWRPSQEWNFNAAYGYERYNYTETDVNVTNENSAKLSADWKPTNWLTARATGYYADRRYDTYDYDLFVASIQFPTIPGFTPSSSSWFYAPAYRQFMFDNRQRTKLDFALDVVAFRGVTVSPTFMYQDDYYGLNPLNQEGIDDSRSTDWGVDVAWVVNPDLRFAFTYYWEYYNQLLYSNTTNGTPTPATFIVTSDKEPVNTVTGAVDYAAIPDKLDLNLRYTISDGVDEQYCSQCTPSHQFPNDTTLLERLDATATYKFDRDWVRQTGFKGDMKAKLRYTWERNSVSNWQNDPLAPFTPSVSATAIWLAYDNPNYNVQMIAASLVASW